MMKLKHSWKEADSDDLPSSALPPDVAPWGHYLSIPFLLYLILRELRNKRRPL